MTSIAFVLFLLTLGSFVKGEQEVNGGTTQEEYPTDIQDANIDGVLLEGETTAGEAIPWMDEIKQQFFEGKRQLPGGEYKRQQFGGETHLMENFANKRQLPGGDLHQIMTDKRQFFNGKRSDGMEDKRQYFHGKRSDGMEDKRQFFNGKRSDGLEDKRQFFNGKRSDGMEDKRQFFNGKRSDGMEDKRQFFNGKRAITDEDENQQKEQQHLISKRQLPDDWMSLEDNGQFMDKRQLPGGDAVFSDDKRQYYLGKRQLPGGDFAPDAYKRQLPGGEEFNMYRVTADKRQLPSGPWGFWEGKRLQSALYDDVRPVRNNPDYYKRSVLSQLDDEEDQETLDQLRDILNELGRINDSL